MAKIAKSNVFEKEKAMKVCPQCRNEFEEEYNFCLQDGTPLVDSISETILENTQNKLAMEDESPVSEETLVLPDTPSNNYSLPITELPTNEEEITQEALKETEATVMPQEQSAIPTEQWKGQNSTANKQIFDVNLDSPTDDDPPMFQSELLSNYDENNNPNKRLAIGGIIGTCLLLFVTVISGYWYLQSPDTSNEIALANTTQSKSETDIANQNSNIELSNLNLALDSDDSNSKDIKQTEEESSKNKEKSDSSNESKKSESATKDSSKSSDSKDSGKVKDRPTASDLRDTGGFDSGGGGGNGSGNGDDRQPPPPPPPPPPKPVPPRVPKRISGGVVNGKATSLPKPAYPPAARAANIKGSVNVAIVISKGGSVMSASAVSGHPLLRRSAVSAARRARFAPTMLAGQAVEVSGVIVYNFQ